MSDSQSIISVNNLVKRYKKSKVNAVDNISFDVKKGEFFAFLGPNGAGKTTVISILTTTLSKTSGKVSISGFDTESQSSSVRQNIGIIFQNHSLDLNLTAEENIRFHALLYNLYPFRPRYKMMPKEYIDQVEKLAKIIGIEDVLHKQVKTFSGGMKRKLEIVRSLMHNPKVLFLDEPTTGLDPASRKNLWQYLLEVKAKEKTTIFLTTHYLEEAEYADRIAIINNGTLVAIGNPDKIKEELVEKYLILDATDRISLKTDLDRLKVFYTEAEHIKVPLNGKTAQEIIANLKTKLTYLNIYNPTLEQAYLQIINKKFK